jgi:hypothetical protein
MFSMSVPSSGDAWDSAIEIINNAPYSIGKRDVSCQVNELKGFGLHKELNPPTTVEIGNATIQPAQTPSQRLEGWGRGDSYECLCPGVTRPCLDTYLSCADITVIMEYSLEDQPDIAEKKSFRFSYNRIRGKWDQRALDSKEVYCN